MLLLTERTRTGTAAPPGCCIRPLQCYPPAVPSAVMLLLTGRRSEPGRLFNVFAGSSPANSQPPNQVDATKKAGAYLVKVVCKVQLFLIIDKSNEKSRFRILFTGSTSAGLRSSPNPSAAASGTRTGQVATTKCRNTHRSAKLLFQLESDSFLRGTHKVAAPSSCGFQTLLRRRGPKPLQKTSHKIVNLNCLDEERNGGTSDLDGAFLLYPPF